VPAGGHNVLEYSSNSISGVGTGQFQNICALTPFAHAENSPQEYPFANYRLLWFSIGPRRSEPNRASVVTKCPGIGLQIHIRRRVTYYRSLLWPNLAMFLPFDQHRLAH